MNADRTERQLDQQWVEDTMERNLRVTARHASRARTFARPDVDSDQPPAGLAMCVFCLIVTLVVLFATGSVPVVKAWVLGWLA